VTGRPSRATPAGRAYLDLQNLARRQGRPTDEFHQIYALEGFLARLAVSAYADQLVLKGGMLLAAYDARRPTRDVDFHARRFPRELEAALDIVREIADISLGDGLEFDTESSTVEEIREDTANAGIRVTIKGRLSTARLTFHVDVNLGDPVVPAPSRRQVPRILGDHLDLFTYPLPMVIAEKAVTAIARAAANTRLRDFADIHMLTGRFDLSDDEVRTAITEVAHHRQVAVRPLWDVLGARFAAATQSSWAAWRRRFRLDELLPGSFTQVLLDVCLFIDPVLDDRTHDGIWRPAERLWYRDGEPIRYRISVDPDRQ
jgi:nucleotidyltransferase AbiEii toxin of type IV toxin-antitoxin system